MLKQADVLLDDPSTQRMSSMRWMVCLLLFMATTINYIDRQILSLVKEALDQQYGLSNKQFGLINTCFQGAYGLGLIWFGRYIDRNGVKKGYTLSIVGWSLAAMIHGLVALTPANSQFHLAGKLITTTMMAVAALCTCRVLLGLSEAGNFPAAIKAVAQWFPRKERALATSLFNSGAQVGAVLAPATVPFLATFGWPTPFIVAGGAGLFWIFFWQKYYGEPETHPSVNEAELAHIKSDLDTSTTQQSVTWAELFSYKQTWGFIMARFLTDPVWWFLLIWLPDMFKETRGLDIKKSALHLVTIYMMITLLSNFGGWLPSFLLRKGFSTTWARKCSLLLFALMVLPLMLVSSLSLWPAVLIIGLAGSAHQAWSANMYTTISDLFPKRAVATVAGIGGMAGSLAGMFFPFVTGMILDHYKHKTGQASDGYAVLFVACSLAYVLAFGVHHILCPRLEPIKELE